MFKSGGLATKIAHSSTLSSLGNKDLRSLQDLINTEKSVITALNKLSLDLSKSSEALKFWGSGEGDDLGDVLSHSASILSHVSNALSVFASHEQTVREHLKSIRTREEKLDETRSRRKAVGSKADTAEKKLSKMGSENKNLSVQTDLLNKLRDEIRQLDSEIMTEEARIGDFKRKITKTFMALKLGGLLEFAEKATIVGELGKLLIEEIPMETTIPGRSRSIYLGREKTDRLEQEVSRCVGEVVFAGSGLQDISFMDAPNADTSGELGQNSFELPPVSRQSEDLPYTLPPVSPHDTPRSGYGSVSSPTRPGTNADTSLEEYNRPYAQGIGSPMTEMDSPHPGPPSSFVHTDPNEGPSGGKFSTFPVHSRTRDTSGHRAQEVDSDFNVDTPNNVRNVSYSSSVGSQNLRDTATPNHNEPSNEDEDSLLPYRTVHFRMPSQEVSPTQLNAPASRRVDREGEGQSPESRKVSFSIPRILPPSESQSEDTEEARNIAAAREVSREMDALTFRPPIDRAPSPLVPPTLPFANRAVSPGPIVTGREQSPIPGSPATVINIPERSRSGSQGSIGGYSSSSRPSLRDFPAPPSGARTISAAAFKKGPLRSENSDDAVGSTNPLNVRKRALPTSPYPPHRSAPTNSRDGTEPLGSGSSNVYVNQPSPRVSQNDLHEERRNVGGEITSPHGDLPPSYESEEGRARVQEDLTGDYGRLGHVRVLNPDEVDEYTPEYEPGNFATSPTQR